MKNSLVKLVIYILCLFSSVIAKAQITIDTITYCSKNLQIEEITITNNSEEDYLTWISRISTTNTPNRELIHRYFFSNHGDFRLFDLVHPDNRVSYLEHKIGIYFIKNIHPNESFTYIINKDNENLGFYDNKISIISRKEVENYIQIPIREDLFFPSSSIALPLAGCKQQMTCTRQKMNMGLFVDHYYTINYEYPSSLDELLFFCNANLSDLQSKEDSILIDYTFFENNAEKISWVINDTLFPKQELIVLYEKDTIAYRKNEWRFPCIGLYNDAYVNCYLKEPESLECFLSFCYYCDSLEDGTNGLYDKCNRVALKNLQKCKQLESFQWINKDDELLMLIGNDTIWHHNNEALPCIDYLKPLFQPHYYDKTGQYVRLEEDLDREFRNNLRGLWYPYVNQSDAKEREYLTLVYGKTRGFYSFCKEDEIDLNIQYFKDMKEYLEKFMDNHGISMVVFAAPAIKTVE